MDNTPNEEPKGQAVDEYAIGVITGVLGTGMMYLIIQGVIHLLEK